MGPAQLNCVFWQKGVFNGKYLMIPIRDSCVDDAHMPYVCGVALVLDLHR